MNLLRPSVLLAVSLLSAASLHAVELRFLSWEGSEGALRFANRGKVVTLRADETVLSQVYTFDGPGPLVLFKEVEREGKIVRETAATLAVPEGATHAIIVLAAVDALRRAYVGEWIDDGPEARPAGTIRLVNLSGHQVAVQLEDRRFTLAPGERNQVSVDGAVQRIVAKAAAQVAGGWKVVADNPLPMRPGLRLLLILRDGRPQPGSEPNVVDLLSFYDRPPPLREGLAQSGR